MLGNGLITEEVFTVQAATEFLQETKHIVDAVHHGEAQKVLLPIKCGCKREAGRNHLKQQLSSDTLSYKLGHKLLLIVVFFLSFTSGYKVVRNLLKGIKQTENNT